MDKNKQYFLSNKIEAIFIFGAILLSLIGSGLRNSTLIRLSAYVFISFGILVFLKFAYFKTAQIIFTDRGKGFPALLWICFESIITIAVGIYILINL